MALKDRFEQEKIIQICNYKKMLDDMPKDDRITLEQAWEAKISRRTIVRVLRAEGYKTSNEAIMAHFGGNCKCTR